MKQTICYLYEYENKKQTKNVGFLKCIFQKDKVIFQIHGKGLECDKTMDLELFLFTVDGTDCRVDKAGAVEGVQGTVNYMVTVENLDSNSMNHYDGILLESMNKKWYTATWKKKEITWERIITNEENKDKQIIEEKNEKEIEQSIQLIEDERLCDIEEEGLEEEAVLVEDDYKADDVQDEVTEITKWNKEAEEEYVRDSKVNEWHDELGTYDKINRHGISKLPQREWKLAHNNFLLHGYKNYKHLMLIRQQGRLFLGVPGIFHRKEEAAAKSFGFPLFHELDEGYKTLGVSEYEKQEGFGYWCRPVTERRGME